MPTPLEFDSSTKSFNLPLLFPGQVQKEFFVNQAFSVIDALLARRLVSSVDAPPADAENGSAYRVTSPASGEWEGQEDAIAIRLADSWQFVQPQPGMSFFDEELGQVLMFGLTWEQAPSIAAPQGGNSVDVEARQAIEDLVTALQVARLLPGA